MKNTLCFLREVGKLKGKARRGWLAHEIKNPETTAEHIFHLAILVWTVGKRKKINVDQAIKMALLHDLCEAYCLDTTPYDPLLPKNLKDKKKIKEILKQWPKFTLSQKIKKNNHKRQMETKALDKLIANLPLDLKREMKNLWHEFENGRTKEARFVRQADKMINFLQGLEYWKKYGKIQHRLWVRWIKEIIDDPALLKFLEATENHFIPPEK